MAVTDFIWLKKCNMAGFFVKDDAELKELIGENSVVGVVDSATLFETGVIDFLHKGNYTFLDKYREGITSEEKKQIYIKNFSADTFMCSTNALTEMENFIILMVMEVELHQWFMDLNRLF